MKRLILFLLLTVCAAMSHVSHAFEVDGKSYEIINESEKCVKLTRCSYSMYDDVTIPDEVSFNDEVYKVTAIGDFVFYVRPVGTLTIGKNVASFDGYAFYVATFKHFEVSPENAWFASLDGVLYTSGYKRLIHYPALKEDKVFTAAAATEEIMREAFVEVPNLEKVILPEGLKIIADDAFLDCSHLAEIIIPSTVEDFGYNPFFWTPWYKSLPDGPLYGGNHVLWFYKGTPEGGVIDVAEGCLSVATGFECYSKVETMRLPKSVTKVNMRSGNNLMYFEVDPENPVYSTFEGMLLSKDGSRMERFPGGRTGQFVVPEVRAIAPYAFAQSALSRVTLPKGVESIGDRAFYYCRDLSRIDLPATLTSIGEKAFEMPIVTPLPAAPRRVRSSNGYYYYINDVYCRAVTPPVTATNAFYNCGTSGATLHVPVGSAEAYRAAAPWDGFGKIVEIDFADVDGDGVVNGADVTALYGALLDGVEPAGIGDVDGDGVVSGADITALYNRLLQ